MAACGRVDGVVLPDLVVSQACETLSLLASPTRLRIVWAIGDGESDVSTLAADLGAAGPAVSQQLTKLRLAGIVRARRDGRRQLYRVAEPEVIALARQALALHDDAVRPG